MDTPVTLATSLQKVLLALGILASLLKAGADFLAGTSWKGYNFISQSISQLTAFGAPTRPLALGLDLLYALLMLAFSLAVWQLAGQNNLMRICAGLMAANVLISAGVMSFLPMRIQASGSPTASTLHVVLMAIAMLCFVGAIALGGAGSPGWLRWYSYATLLLYVILTIVGVLASSGAAAASRTGLQERSMVLGYLLWVIAMAVHHLRVH